MNYTESKISWKEFLYYIKWYFKADFNILSSKTSPLRIFIKKLFPPLKYCLYDSFLVLWHFFVLVYHIAHLLYQAAAPCVNHVGDWNVKPREENQ